jgi:hypothetical protein
MFEHKRILSLTYVSLLLAVILNIFLVKTAHSIDLKLYWLLMLSIPMLVFTIYHARKKIYKFLYEKNDNVTKLNSASDQLLRSDHLLSAQKDEPIELTVLFGNNYCAQPYLSGIICNEAATVGQDINGVHRKINLLKEECMVKNIEREVGNIDNDIIWKIAPGYAGCRDQHFNFDRELFSLNAGMPSVKMIELKLSRPIRKYNVSAKRNAYTHAVIQQKYQGIILKPILKHSAFSNAESMAIFLDSLRQLSGRKPVGIRLCITDKKELHEICYAFRKTEIIPDYIVIEDSANECEPLLTSSKNPIMPLFETLLFVSKTLELYGLREEIKIIAATEIYTGFDALKILALGAQAICIRNEFEENEKYDAANSPELMNFSQRHRHDFRKEIYNSAKNILRSWGYTDIKDISIATFFRSLDDLSSQEIGKNYTSGFRVAQHENPLGIVRSAYIQENKKYSSLF